MRYQDLETSTKVILKIIFFGVALWLLWDIRNIILLLLLSLIIASAMEPLVDYFHAKKVPRFLSVLMVYLVVLGFSALIIYLMIPPVIEQFKILLNNLPEYGKALQSQLGGYDVQGFFQGLVGTFSNSGNVVSGTFSVFNSVLEGIAVLVISFYLVAEQKGMKTFVSSIIPAHHHDFTLNLLEKIQKKMGMWVISQFIICFGIFAFTYIGLQYVLHVPYALVLSLLAGLFEIVPFIGPFLSAIPAMFIGFIQAPSMAIWVAVLYLFVHEFEAYVLVPKIMEKTVGQSPLLTMVALLVGYQLAGVVGIIISVPVAVAITEAIKDFWPSEKG